MGKLHRYETSLSWSGNRGSGTTGYDAYDRSYATRADGRPDMLGSSDPAFRGDAGSWNPELLLVAALSQCHLLSYLHRCAISDVSVCGYRDDAVGVMVEDADGGGHFREVVLRPTVVVRDTAMVERAIALHAAAAAVCFLVSSVNFPVRHEPHVRAET